MTSDNLSRHGFLRGAGAFSLGASFMSSVPAASGQDMEKRRPNILFCIADDWSWPHASIAGDKVARTPTFDRVAREGVLFDHAFVTAPSCTASRGSIVTGQ